MITTDGIDGQNAGSNAVDPIVCDIPTGCKDVEMVGTWDTNKHPVLYWNQPFEFGTIITHLTLERLEGDAVTWDIIAAGEPDLDPSTVIGLDHSYTDTAITLAPFVTATYRMTATGPGGSFIYNVVQINLFDDKTSPTVQVTSPVVNSSLTGPFSISASAQDNIGLSRIEFYVSDRGKFILVATLPMVGLADSKTFAFDPSTRPFANHDTLNAPTVGPGGHTILVRAYDATSPTPNSKYLFIPVTLANPNNETGQLIRANNDGHTLVTENRGNCNFIGVTVDSLSGVIVIGTYATTSATIFGLAVSSGGPINTSGFFCKVDASGILQWHKIVDGAGCTPLCVATDSSNNIYIAGTFLGTMNLGGSDLTSSGGSANTFLVKYDTNGNHLFSIRLPGGTNSTYGMQVSGGKVYLTGYFLFQTDFGGGTRTGNPTSPDGFVAQYNASDLSYVWDTVFTGGNYNYCNGLAVDGSGNVYVSGQTQGDLNCGGGNLPYAGGLNAGFLAGFNSAGTHLWSRPFGINDSNANASGKGMVFGSGGLWMFGTSRLGTFALDSVSVPAPGSTCTFAIQINPATGGAIQGFSFGGFDTPASGSAAAAASGAMDSNGFLLLAGKFQGETNFGDSQIQGGTGVAFIAKYHPLHGLIVWYAIDAGIGPLYKCVFPSPVDRSIYAVGGFFGGMTIQGTFITSISTVIQDAMLVHFTP